MRFVLDGRIVDETSGMAHPVTAADVAALIMRSDEGRMALLAAIRAAQPAGSTPFSLVSAPMILLERVEHFLAGSTFQPDVDDDGDATYDRDEDAVPTPAVVRSASTLCSVLLLASCAHHSARAFNPSVFLTCIRVHCCSVFR